MNNTWKNTISKEARENVKLTMECGNTIEFSGYTEPCDQYEKKQEDELPTNTAVITEETPFLGEGEKLSLIQPNLECYACGSPNTVYAHFDLCIECQERVGITDAKMKADRYNSSKIGWTRLGVGFVR